MGRDAEENQLPCRTFRGVEFTDQVTDRGYGLVTHFKVPGDFEVQLYQPRYTKHPDARQEA